MNRSAFAGSRTFSPAWAAVLIGCSLPAAALAQSQGGLYIAGSGFSFEQAATQGIEIYAEHSEDARINPGKHPNIDRLIGLVERGETLRVKHVFAA